MKVEVLYVADCPSHPTAVELVKYALAKHDIAEQVIEVLVKDENMARERGRGVLGVIDRSPPKGIEGQADIAWRHDVLRQIGYKR